MVRQFIQGREAVVRQFVRPGVGGGKAQFVSGYPCRHATLHFSSSSSSVGCIQGRWTKNTGYLNWVPEGQSSPSRLDVFLNFLPTFFLHIYCTSMIYFSVVVFFLFSIFPCPLSCFPSLCYLFDANVKIVVPFTVQR